MTASNSIELSRQERKTIALSLDFTLKELALVYAASCNAGKPNRVLLGEHGRVMRLRDKMLTGRSYAQQDADAQRAANASEMALRQS